MTVRPDQDTSRPLRRIAFGSCRKQKRPQPVWDAVAATEPELWLWTGDSIYPQTPTTPELLRSAYEELVGPLPDWVTRATPPPL